MIAVLVGGPADGRRLKVRDDLQCIRVAQRFEILPLPSYGSAEVCTRSVTDTEYRIVYREGEYAFAVPRDNRNPLMALIQGYRHELVQ